MRSLFLSVIKKYFKLFLSITLVSSLGGTIMIGLSSGHISVKGSTDRYLEEGHYPDAFVTTAVTEKDISERISELDEVRQVDSRLTADSYVISPKGRILSVSAFSYADTDLQKFYFWDKIDPDTDEYVYIDYMLAKGNDIHAGEKIRIKIEDEYRIYTVAGLVSMPETMAIQTQSNKWNTNSDFGYVYASEKLLEKETEKRREEAVTDLNEKKELLDDTKKQADSAMDEIEVQLEIAKLQIDLTNQLYASFAGGTAADTAILLDARNKLVSLTGVIGSLKEELTATLAEMNFLLDEAEKGIVSLEEAVSGIDDLLVYEQQALSAKEQLSTPETQAFMAALRHLNNFDIASLFNAISAFNDILTLAQSYGFYYDFTQPVQSIVSALQGFLAQCESDRNELLSSSMADLIVRIINGEPGITQTAEYAHLIAVLSRYMYGVNDGNVIDAYYTVASNLDTLITYVRIYNIDGVLPMVVSFASSDSLYEMAAKAQQIEELVPLISAFSEISVTTTQQLVNAFDIVSGKIDAALEEIHTQKEKLRLMMDAMEITIDDIPALIEELQRTVAEGREKLGQADQLFDLIDTGLSSINTGIGLVDEILNVYNIIPSAIAPPSSAASSIAAYENDLDLARAEAMKKFSDVDQEIEKAFTKLDETEGYQDLANQFLIHFEDGVDPETALKKIEKILGEECEVKDSYTYEDSPVKARIAVNTDPMEVLSYFLPVLFFSIVLVVVFLFMSLIIRQCRREIGILRALGFSKSKITGVFCMISLISALFAIVLGLAIGMVAAWIIKNIYVEFYPLPISVFRLNIPMFLGSSALTIIVGQLATVLSARAITSISPAEAMSRSVSDNRELPGFVKKMIRGFSPINKFSVASLLRNPMKFVFSIICIASTIVLILVSLSVYSACNIMVDNHFDKRVLYDSELYFTKEPDKKLIDELRSNGYVSEIYETAYYAADFTYGNHTESGILQAIEPDSHLIGIYDENKQDLSLSDNGIIIESVLADDLGVQKGDQIEVNGQFYTIEGISQQHFSFANYVSLNNKALSKDADIYTLICNIDPAKEQEMTAYLTKQDGYLYSISTDISRKTTNRAMHLHDTALFVIIGFAVSIGMIIILNTSMTNILEKKKELSILRTLGFQFKEISRSWFMQSVLFFICSCIVGIPLGVWIAKITLHYVTESNGRLYVFASLPSDYLMTVGLVFIYIAASHWLTMNAFRKWDYVENVKDKE